MRQYFKSRTPALRVPRLHETYSVDWIDSSVPSVYGGQVGAHIFYGKKSKTLQVYGGHGPSDFPDHLTQFIVDKGAPTQGLLLVGIFHKYASTSTYLWPPIYK